MAKLTEMDVIGENRDAAAYPAEEYPDRMHGKRILSPGRTPLVFKYVVWSTVHGFGFLATRERLEKLVPQKEHPARHDAILNWAGEHPGCFRRRLRSKQCAFAWLPERVLFFSSFT